MRNHRLQWIPVSVELTANLTNDEFFADANDERIIETRVEFRPAHDSILTVRDELIFLLHTAAEVEHALMAQYLFAAWSISLSDAKPNHQIWRSDILTIAQQEMGHLATVQNMLRAIGGQLNFEREDYPFRSDFYPFHFRLEPLSIFSLAKYVIAEMPDDSGIPPAELEIIIRRAEAGNEEMTLNRVGLLYKQILNLLEQLDESEFMPYSRPFQGADAHWFSEFNPMLPLNEQIIVSSITGKAEAHDALCKIAIQGEGMTACSEATVSNSHFDRFLRIYRERAAEGTEEQISPIASNPNTIAGEITDEDLKKGQISNETTVRWARLFNLRYRMLLTDLSHYFHLAGDVGNLDATTPRGFLRNRALRNQDGTKLGEMVILGLIAGILTRMPQLKESIDQPPFAGPPFEMDYTLALPDLEPDRWRLHRDLIFASGLLMEEIVEKSGDIDGTIEFIQMQDTAALVFVEEQVNH